MSELLWTLIIVAPFLLVGIGMSVEKDRRASEPPYPHRRRRLRDMLPKDEPDEEESLEERRRKIEAERRHSLIDIFYVGNINHNDP